jgi:hypothetical protein
MLTYSDNFGPGGNPENHHAKESELILSTRTTKKSPLHSGQQDTPHKLRESSPEGTQHENFLETYFVELRGRQTQ